MNNKRDDFLNEVVKDSTSEVRKQKKDESENFDEIGNVLKKKYHDQKNSKMLQTVSVRLPMSLYEKLNRKAKAHDVSIGTLSRDLLEIAIDKI